MGSASDYDKLEYSIGRGPQQLLIRNNLTATAGGGQANALQLGAEMNEVATCATDGDSVKLPQIVQPGVLITIIHRGAKNLQVYGTGTDTINDVAAATGVTQMAGSVTIYTSSSGGKWYTTGLGVGYSGSLEVYSVKDGIVAHAGGTQAAAIADAASQVPAMNNRIATCATGGDSVVLPAAKPGMYVTVANDGAASCNVFPFTGETINQGAANAAFAVGIAKAANFFCIVAGKWHAVLSA
jgi:hypothetical protein